MSTGLVHIDEQHKELIHKLNELMTAMKQRRGQAEIEKILNFLAHYVKAHFSDEESCMENYHCPLAGVNREAHAKFIEKFLKFRDQYQEEGPSAALAIVIQRDLLDWLIHHIRRVDASLHACVRGAALPGMTSVASRNGRHLEGTSIID